MQEYGPPSPTIGRLNALMAAGYEIDTAASQKVMDAIWLDHPATRWVPSEYLILYPDGLVVGSSTRETKQLRLDPADKAAFARFIQTVPRPTAWQKAWRIRELAAGWVVWLVLALASYAILSLLVSLYKWTFQPR
jgi:hypothetical protein